MYGAGSTGAAGVTAPHAFGCSTGADYGCNGCPKYFKQIDLSLLTLTNYLHKPLNLSSFVRFIQCDCVDIINDVIF
jgi:hypothetical protein